MSISCCWCGRALDLNSRIGWMRELLRLALPALDPNAVVPVYPAAPALHVTVNCSHCRATVTVPADCPVASA